MRSTLPSDPGDASRRWITLVVPPLLLLGLSCGWLPPRTAGAGERKDIQVVSSLDQVKQPCYLILPDDYSPDDKKSRPLLVALHSWSAGVEQRREQMEQGADRRGWFYLFPHFRGRNDDPNACGSLKAQQDILDAVQWVQKRFPVDSRRIYLAGGSGGGHMTMLMVGRHPKVWAAASAWVGISDLASWHKRHAGDRYGKMMRACCGGRPGDSAEVDRQYKLRSPLTHLHNAVGVPLEMSAGVHDGHRGSVPIRHSLDAFNVIAKAGKHPVISEAEIQQLSRPNGRLTKPRSTDRVADPAYGRAIHLRRHAGPCRVTIFEGGHESLPAAALDWLARHRKPADRP